MGSGLFRSYLWGMETCMKGYQLESLLSFRSYLWGMETSSSNTIRSATNSFRSYLWGMETSIGHPLIFISNKYSDPTYEAWKLSWLSFLRDYERNSDPTYEAWKPQYWLDNMRGNRKFRSYLWGMETWNPLLQPFFCQHIPILPMRHGNSKSTLCQRGPS